MIHVRRTIWSAVLAQIRFFVFGMRSPSRLGLGYQNYGMHVMCVCATARVLSQSVITVL